MANIEYTGTTGYSLQAEQPVREDEGGNLTASRRYVGDGSERASFLALWPRGAAHPTDGRLYVSHYTYDNRAAGPAPVTIHFKGGTDLEGTMGSGDNGRVVRTEMLERVAKITKGGTEYRITYECPTRYVEWTKRADQKTPAKQGTSGIDDFTSVNIKTCDPAEGVADPNTFFTKSTDYDLESIGSLESEPSGEVWRIVEAWQRVVINIT